MEKRNWKPFVFGGLSSIVAEFGTFPIDTVKTRLQTIKYKDRYNGMINCFVQVKRQEGLKALYSGIWPAVLRQAVYGTIKFGSYYTLKSFICSKLASDTNKDNLNSENSWINIGCATFAGAFSSAIANPTDVLKVRMQVHGRGTDKLGLFKCFYEIYANEGVRGLWRGVGPTSQRAAIIAAVELPVYDFCKHYLLDTIGDHVFNHFISSFIASLGSAIASTPVDVIRTRLMNQKRLIHPNPTSNLQPAKLYFSNSIECAIYTVKNEGIMALYKGFLPTWIRMGPWNIIFFITYEQLKKL